MSLLAVPGHSERTSGGDKVATYLVNHLRIPGDIPNLDALSYLEQVEATVAP